MQKMKDIVPGEWRKIQDGRKIKHGLIGQPVFARSGRLLAWNVTIDGINRIITEENILKKEG